MEISFILVAPQVPENVGAAARALKTMGFERLRLVDPCDHLSDRARWTAHGSNDVLEAAQVYPDTAAATADLDFTIGTTARRRSFRREIVAAADLPQALARKGDTIHRVGVLFGREEWGLTNDELLLCDLLSTVPLAAPYPSLNLAQAVMIYAYELSPLRLQPEPRIKVPSAGEYRTLFRRVEALCKAAGLDEKPFILRRLLQRLALVGADDVRLLHSLCDKLEVLLGPPQSR